MGYVIVAIIVYLLSTYKVYKFIQIAHSIGGRWHGLNTGLYDLFMTVMPGLNTMFAIITFFTRVKEYEEQFTANKLFNIKK
jgi:hypothetical protein